MAREQKDISEKVLWVIDSKVNEKMGGGSDLRILQWLIDGKPTRPLLEKRDWFTDQEGNRKIGKAKGMGTGDVYLILRNIKAIAKLMEMKPQHLDEALQLAMFEDDKTKKVTQPPADIPFGDAPSPAKATPEPVVAGTGTIPDVDF